MFCKKWSGVFSLFLLISTGFGQKEKNKPAKPIFPNLVLPEAGRNQFGTLKNFQEEPSQFSNPPFEQPDYDYQLPPVPELFRLSATRKPSTLQKMTPNQNDEPLTTTMEPIPETTTTEAPTTTTRKTSKPTPKRNREIFPGLTDKSQRGKERTEVDKLGFKGLPQPTVRPFINQFPQQQNDPQQLEPQNIQDTIPDNVNALAIQYKIAVVADLGSEAKLADGGFRSFLKEGTLSLQQISDNPRKWNVMIDFDINAEPHLIQSRLNIDNEGFELSTLNVFHGKLYSCDDETGILYELKEVPVKKARTLSKRQRPESFPATKNTTYIAQPWIILSNEGENAGFRCEWATVKGGHLWVGSTGILVRNPEEENEFDRTRQAVKKVSPSGKVVTIDWSKNYEKMSKAIGLPFDKGFVVHEGVAWSELLKVWLFTPRRINRDRSGAQLMKGKQGGNAAIMTDENFENYKIDNYGELVTTAGFTSLKFIPGTGDQLVLALKAGYDSQANKLMSTLEVFDINGKSITPEVPIGKGIYAGVEFI